MGKTAWILTDGKKGTENQCIGLAQALSLQPIIKRIQPKFPWSILPPHLWMSPLKGVKGIESHEPWPDILIAASRSAGPVAKEIRRLSQGKTFVIFLQNPYISPSHFDVVIAPQHDQLKGKNVIETLGALHGITPKVLEEAYEHHKKTFAHLPLKKVSILLGGKTHHYEMTPQMMGQYGTLLKKAANSQKVGYLVTASRRTSEECFAHFKEGLGDTPCYIWDGKGDNPYTGFLAHSDVILVTEDSVSMISEAIATGKPVYLLTLKGHSKRLSRFHNALLEKGCVRLFEGSLEPWAHESVDTMTHVVEQLSSLGFRP